MALRPLCSRIANQSPNLAVQLGVEGDGSGEAFVLGSDLISSVNDRR
jgi:hypothetical protein